MSLDAKLERVKRRLQMCREVLHGSYEIDWRPRESSWKTDLRSKKHYPRERDGHRHHKQESARNWGGRREKSVKQWQSELEKYNKYLEPRYTSRTRKSSDSEEARWESPVKYAFLVDGSSDSDVSDSSSSSSVTEGLTALLYKLKSESRDGIGEKRAKETPRKEREHVKKHREREEKKYKGHKLHVKNENASTGIRKRMERDVSPKSPEKLPRRDVSPEKVPRRDVSPQKVLRRDVSPEKVPRRDVSPKSPEKVLSRDVSPQKVPSRDERVRNDHEIKEVKRVKI